MLQKFCNIRQIHICGYWRLHCSVTSAVTLLQSPWDMTAPPKVFYTRLLKCIVKQVKRKIMNPSLPELNLKKKKCTKHFSCFSRVLNNTAFGPIQCKQQNYHNSRAIFGVKYLCLESTNIHLRDVIYFPMEIISSAPTAYPSLFIPYKKGNLPFIQPTSSPTLIGETPEDRWMHFPVLSFALSLLRGLYSQDQDCSHDKQCFVEKAFHFWT